MKTTPSNYEIRQKATVLTNVFKKMWELNTSIQPKGKSRKPKLRGNRIQNYELKVCVYVLSGDRGTLR